MGFVQYKQTTGGNVASLASPSLTMGGGDLIVVICWVTNGGTNTLNSVVDGTNTYIQIPGTIGTGSTGGTVLNSQIWYAQNVTAGTRTVTMNWGVSASGGFSQIQVLEYSGIAASLALDTGVFVSGTSTSPGGTITMSYWNDLIVCGIRYIGSGASWLTMTDRTGTGGVVAGDATFFTNGLFTVASNPGTSANWAGPIANFKFASGASQYEALNEGANVQLPVVGSVPSAADASMTLTSPELSSTPVLGNIPGFINFTSPTMSGTPTLAEMATAPYYIIGSALSGGFTGAQWLNNVFILPLEYWDKSTTIYTGQLFPVPESDTAQAGNNKPAGLGQVYPTSSKRRHYPF